MKNLFSVKIVFFFLFLASLTNQQNAFNSLPNDSNKEDKALVEPIIREALRVLYTRLASVTQFPTASTSYNISHQCKADSQNYNYSYINQHNWALRSKKIIFILWIIDPFDDRWFIFQLEVHESSGHFPEGLFTDRNTNAVRSYGLFDECIDTQGPAINGKYCTIFFNIEEVRPEELDNSTIRQIQESGKWNT